MSLIVNNDFMVYVHKLYNAGYVPAGRDAAIADIREDIRQYAGTGVTDIVYNPNAQLSYSPSAVWEYAEARYQKNEVDGIPVNFKGNYLDLWHTLSVEYGIDLYEIFLDETRKCGIRAWLSFRTNDVHDNFESTGSLRRCDYTHEARRNGLVRCRHRDAHDYYDNGLDFGIPSVRERFLAYVKEQLFRYDTDGIEIDFMREPYLFRPGYEDEGRATVRQMMREIRDLCNARAAALGHPVFLALRTFRDLQSDFYSGIDAVGLAKEGLLDLVTVTPRWESCDSGMPIGLWRNVLPAGVRLALGTDVLYRSAQKDGHFYTDEQLYGLASQAYGEGADCVYLFNYEYRFPAKDPRLLPALQTAASKESLAEAKKRYTVSYQDVCATGETAWHPLPATLGHPFHSLRIPTGDAGEKLYLLLGVKNTENTVIYVNSAPVKYLGKISVEQELCKEECALYEVEKVRPCHQMLELRAKCGGEELSYIELRNYL